MLYSTCLLHILDPFTSVLVIIYFLVNIQCTEEIAPRKTLVTVKVMYCDHC